MRIVSARMCASPGRAFERQGGKLVEVTLKKRHCGKMTGMVDVKAPRKVTCAVLRVRGRELYVPMARMKGER